MIFVVFGIVGWPRKQQQDQVFNSIESGKVGKTQFTAGLNQTQPVGNSPFGNYFRVEFEVGTDADAVWGDLKNYLAANPPVPGSRIRRLDCPWDAGSSGDCTLIEELIWLLDGSVLTRP